MEKSFWFRLRTNLPCLSVAMNRTLTSFTRVLMVKTDSSESGPEEGMETTASLPGAKEVTCARNGNPAAATNTPSKKYFPMYFIPHPVPSYGVCPPCATSPYALLDARHGPKHPPDAAFTARTLGDTLANAKLQKEHPFGHSRTAHGPFPR